MCFFGLLASTRRDGRASTQSCTRLYLLVCVCDIVSGAKELHRFWRFGLSLIEKNFFFNPICSMSSSISMSTSCHFLCVCLHSLWLWFICRIFWAENILRCFVYHTILTEFSTENILSVFQAFLPNMKILQSLLSLASFKEMTTVM